ncbi:MAG TPA: dienelactone hydrolase family protein [Oligoflexia bacterium]|nr:dienelactone hydrolase family protein [Oligoflexia bacterium]HMR25693.1 dienelactone hydrolase family protein [Oligoflexia bacterium]
MKQSIFLSVLLSFSTFFMPELQAMADKAAVADKGIETEKIKYSWDDQEFHGYLAKPKKIKNHTPAILIVHEWWGHNEYAQKRARMLAEEGYIALAIDMYGDGARADHPSEAGKMASKVSGNIDLMKKRFTAGMKILSSQAMVDREKIAALGYCFGGGVVLQMARERLPLTAVISYHGSLATNSPVNNKEDMPNILVFHGSDDSLISKEDLENFKQEMNAAQANYKVVEFSGAKHAFTNPEATKLGEKFSLPLAYDEEADQRSWQESLAFLKDVFTQAKQKTVKAKVVKKNNKEENQGKNEDKQETPEEEKKEVESTSDKPQE